MNERKKAPARAYHTKELAALYEVNTRTLYRWLKPYRDEIGPRTGYFFSVLQVGIIFDILGWPEVPRERGE